LLEAHRVTSFYLSILYAECFQLSSLHAQDIF
jgi:hypothetical protein